MSPAQTKISKIGEIKFSPFWMTIESLRMDKISAKIAMMNKNNIIIPLVWMFSYIIAQKLKVQSRKYVMTKVIDCIMIFLLLLYS